MAQLKLIMNYNDLEIERLAEKFGYTSTVIGDAINNVIDEIAQETLTSGIKNRYSVTGIRQGPFKNAELATLTEEEEIQSISVEQTSTRTETTTMIGDEATTVTEHASSETGKNLFGFSTY
jgi:nucleoid DNA-binding protein